MIQRKPRRRCRDYYQNMPVHNEDIAGVFEEIANLLEIEGENPFRIRAYRNGARTLRELGEDVRMLVQRGEDITQLPGIGRNLAENARLLSEVNK